MKCEYLDSHFKTKSIDKEISKIALKLPDYVNKVFFVSLQFSSLFGF